MDSTSNALIPAAAEVEGFCDADTWETLSKSFREVQALLDRNRRLIQQVNENHRSRIPQNLCRNVDLICEIDSNMKKVVALYSNLSAKMSAIVHQRRAVAEAASKKAGPSKDR